MKIAIFLIVALLLGQSLAAETKILPSKLDLTKNFGGQLKGVTDGTAAQDTTTLKQSWLKLNKSSDALGGNLAAGGYKITGLGAGTSTGDAARMGQLWALVNKSGDTMTGNLAITGYDVTGVDELTFDASGPDVDLNGRKLADIGAGTTSTDASNMANTWAKLNKSGDTLTGTLAATGQDITGIDDITFDADGSTIDFNARKLADLGAPTTSGDAVRYQDLYTKINKSGDTMSGALAMGSQKITGLAAGTSTGNAATVEQVWSQINKTDIGTYISGTSGYIPKFTGANAIAGNSPVSVSGNNISIAGDISQPAYSAIRQYGGVYTKLIDTYWIAGVGDIVRFYTPGSYTGNPVMTLGQYGWLGIGKTPAYPLDVNGAINTESYLQMTGIGTQAAPAANAIKIYSKSGVPVYRNETGEYSLAGGEITLTGGDFYGTASSTTDDIITFADTGGKTAKDSGKKLSHLVYKDGSTTLTGALPFGGYKGTGIANGTAVQDVAAYGQVVDSPRKNAVTIGFTQNCTYRLDPADTDHTDEINAALDHVNGDSSKSKVYFTVGRYRIHDASVVIHHFTEVTGENWPMNPGLTPEATSSPDLYKRFTVFDVTYTGGPAVKINGGSKIENIYFNYSEQNGINDVSWTAYPESIKTVSSDDTSDPGDADTYAQGICIQNIFGRNPYTFINMSSHHGSNVIDNVWGCPIYRGIVISNGGDGDHITRVHFTPPAYGWSIGDNSRLRNYIRNNAIGIKVSSTADHHGADGLTISQCVVFDYYGAYKFEDVGGSPSIADSIADSCKEFGVYVGGYSYGMRIVNCGLSVGNYTNLASHTETGYGIQLADASSGTVINGCQILSRSDGIYSAVSGTDFYGGAVVGPVITGCNIVFNTQDKTTSAWGVQIWDGDESKISDNIIVGGSFTKSDGIGITSNPESASVTGNTIVGCDENSIYFGGHDGQVYGNMIKDSAASAIGGTGTVGINGDNIRVT